MGCVCVYEWGRHRYVCRFIRELFRILPPYWKLQSFQRVGLFSHIEVIRTVLTDLWTRMPRGFVSCRAGKGQ